MVIKLNMPLLQKMQILESPMIYIYRMEILMILREIQYQ
nr:MAG TPA: hypothetical protein [Caudoviricetes sp.]